MTTVTNSIFRHAKILLVSEAQRDIETAYWEEVAVTWILPHASRMRALKALRGLSSPEHLCMDEVGPPPLVRVGGREQREAVAQTSTRGVVIAKHGHLHLLNVVNYAAKSSNLQASRYPERVTSKGSAYTLVPASTPPSTETQGARTLVCMDVRIHPQAFQQCMPSGIVARQPL